MAKLNNPLFKGLSGTIDNLVFRQVNGKTVVSLKPDKSLVPPSARQIQHRKIFAEANAWAKEITNNPLRRANYEHLVMEGKKLNNILKSIRVAELRLAAGLSAKAEKAD